MKIKDLPDSSKPRERFLKHGPEALSDAELLTLKGFSSNDSIFFDQCLYF